MAVTETEQGGAGTFVHSVNLYILGLLTIHESHSHLLMQGFIIHGMHSAFNPHTFALMDAS